MDICTCSLAKDSRSFHLESCLVISSAKESSGDNARESRSSNYRSLISTNAIPSPPDEFQFPTLQWPFKACSSVCTVIMTTQVPPEPKNQLGRHRILAPTAAVHVSPLCLGAMNFGSAWKEFMGECSKETAFAMMDYFHHQGGNFIDTYLPSIIDLSVC